MDKVSGYVTDLSNRIVDGNSISDVLSTALLYIKTLTESDMAYIAEIGTRENLKIPENPQGYYMHMLHIYSLGLKIDPEKVNKDYNMTFINNDTLYGKSILGSEIVLSNNVATDKRHNGSGILDKTLVKNFVAIPMIWNKKIVGHLGIGHHPGNYTHEYVIQLDQLYKYIAFLLWIYVTNEENKKNENERQLNNAKNISMANISHEIRTPLNSIIGLLSVLEDTKLDDNQIECINIMRESSYNLLGLINDILDISKLEAGKMEIKLAPVDIIQCIEESNKVTSTSALGKKLTFTYQTDPNIPPYVLADPQRLKQILVNLLSNAYKFTEKGGIFVKVSEATKYEVETAQLPAIEKIASRASLESQSKINRAAHIVDRSKIGDWMYIKFSVTDTGIGINEKDIDKLFKNFSQVDNTSSKKYSGNGLGLAICNKFCDLMKGYIGVTSKYGAGSTFYFILPLQIYNQEKQAVLNYNVLKGIKVLIVDDNENNLISICQMLDKWQIDHVEASSGKRALLSYISNDKYSFNLAIIEVHMSDLDGNELCQRIIKAGKKFPMIAVTSRGTNNDINSLFASVLVKPFTEEQLLKSMINTLERPRESPPTTPPLGLPQGQYQEIPAASKSSRSRDILTPHRRSIRNTIDETETNIDLNILIAEDNHYNQIVLVKFLNSLGYFNIDIAVDGQIACDMIKANKNVLIKRKHKKFLEKSKYDLILMDIVMPIKDGEHAAIEIIGMFKERIHCPKIIAVTVNAMPGDKERYLSIGINAYLPKPIENKRQLADAINAVFKK
jgi:signal transduction histidine kinase/DNA-binding response OmpR family regulator